MFDRDLVTSGFDTETLISEKYLTYLLLAQIDAGLLPLEFDVVDAPSNTNLTVKLHPPVEPDYQRLYTPSDDPPLPDPVASSFRTRLLPGEASAFNDLAFAPDGRHLLTRSADNVVRVWDLEERTQDDGAAFGVSPAVCSAFNALGTQIATGSADRKVRIWDLQSKAVVTTLEGHTHVVECVAFSADGQRLASGSLDQTLRVWDLASGTPVLTLTGHAVRVRCVAFNHAGTQVASGDGDGTVRLWDAQSGAPLQVLSGHTALVNCLAFSPDDLRIASGSDDNTVRLWDVASGATIRSYTGHTDAVLCVDISANGALLLSGSKDNTLKLWSANQTGALRTMSDHRSDVTRVRFGNAAGRNASASAGGSIRIWDNVFAPPPPKTTELRMDFMRVEVFTTVIDHSAGDQMFEGVMALIAYLAIHADLTPGGLETNHRLRLSFGRLDPATKALLEASNVDVQLVEETLRQRLDRDLPLGIAQGRPVQQIRMKKLFGADGRRTLAIYVNLALRSGPGNEFLPPRGNVNQAQDFREPPNAIAFGTSPGLFALLGRDAKFQRAERKPGGPGYRYPLRKDMFDPRSGEIGTIDGISVGPEIIPGSPQVATGRLEFDVDATYSIDSFPDVGFSVQLFFNPERDADGVVKWELDIDVDLGLFATLLFVVGGLVVLSPFIAVGIGFWLIVGALASVVGGRGIAEHLLAKKIAEEVDEESLASMVDALPTRVPAVVRRWDPFYETEHQIVAKLDERMIIDERGIAFTADELALDKEPVPRADIAPRGEERDGGTVSAVRYDVPDFSQFTSDFTAKAPAIDRMDFVRSDPVGSPTVVTLTVDQILERKALEEPRVLAPIVLDARRIYMAGGQIDQLLCTTWLIRTRERDRLIGLFQRRTRDEINANERAAIEQDAIDDLTEKLHRAPTQEEIDEEVDLRIDALITERQEDFEDDGLRDDLHDALAPLLRFDVAPEELITLQEKGVFVLDGKEIIVRENRNGTRTPYYRDRPDGDPRDNLLSLPHYAFPYVPPPA